MELKKSFNLWIKSIFETEHIDEEINMLYIIVKNKSKLTYLELCGFEGAYNVHKLCFHPLSAQFFTHKDLQNIQDKILIYRLKNIIQDMQDDMDLKYYIKKKKINIMFDLRPKDDFN